ncbi:Hypothetical predicted protein [Lecanosticta acicola]|uniref:Uncharacterized protein n=1 Tax=Lecanosticta acicola TaxID=111012 RepID=A0AAI8Z3U6_9PEZI|nr:Hypothetical predicted protein [Lecanosticta acicola]
MSTLAPIYRPAASQQSFLTREQKRERERKRKRETRDDQARDDDGESDSSDEPVVQKKDDAPRVLHPVNKTDPYYVAGHPREKPLPGDNFPHAAVKEYKAPQPPVEEELASLNPPLYVPKVTPEDASGSLRRRHLDNLAAILHQRMLHGDWSRASRVWGLILRTEVQGYGPDIRQNGRWMIGAELLMRRNQSLEQQYQRPSTSSSAESEHDQGASGIAISDEGFQLARDYYQRLALQYPHHARAHHSIVTALAIYPALFSVWVYEIQDRAQRLRDAVKLSISDRSEMSSPGNDHRSDTSERTRRMQNITSKELERAVPLVQRLDELMLNPPYDTSSELLHIQGMVCLWISDLHKALSESPSSTQTGSSSEDERLPSRRLRSSDVSIRHHQQQASTQREKAKSIFRKMIATKMDVPEHIGAFLQEAGDNDV